MPNTPFLGELALFSFDFAPRNWARCDGQLLPINQNQPLFSLLGTTFGGDGRNTFGLPDLRGRTPMHAGNDFGLGTVTGQEFHTVSIAELPSHTHELRASSTTADQPVPRILASSQNLYREPGDVTTLHPSTLAGTGGSQPHENRQPYLTLTWCIALQGIFPSET